MTRSGGVDRLSICGCVVGALAIATPTALLAQTDTSSSLSRIRTGPSAKPPLLPAFPMPVSPADGIVPADPGATQPVPASGAGRITHVRISAEGNGRTAIPPNEWSPPPGADDDFGLKHRHGEPLDLAWVQSQFDQHLGPDGIRPSAAVALVQLINRAFITAGFVNSGLLVSRQADAATGVLDLQLIFGRLVSAEGSPQRVSVEWGPSGASGLSGGYIRKRFPSSRHRPLNALMLEQDFRLLAEDPMIRSVSAALRPGRQPGEATLQLIVHPAERLDVYIGAANDRSPSVGGQHVLVGGYFRSALSSGDFLTAEAGLTEGVKDAEIGYATPFLSPAHFLSFRAAFNNAAVIDEPLLPLDIRARDRNAELGLSHQLRRRPLMATSTPGRWSSSQTLTTGISLFYRKQKSFLLGEPFSFAPGSVNGRTEYKAGRMTADFVQRNVDHVIAVSLSGTVGLGGTQSEIESVPNPSDHFVAALGQLNLAKRLGAGFELRARIVGQYSGGILYSGERLSIGGATSVRGYRESLYLVDRGLIGSVELAYPFSLSRPRAGGEIDLGAFTASIFADGATFKNATAPQPDRTFISSVGGSLAWAPSDALSAIGS